MDTDVKPPFAIYIRVRGISTRSRTTAWNGYHLPWRMRSRPVTGSLFPFTRRLLGPYLLEHVGTWHLNQEVNQLVVLAARLYALSSGGCKQGMPRLQMSSSHQKELDDEPFGRFAICLFIFSVLYIDS